MYKLNELGISGYTSKEWFNRLAHTRLVLTCLLFFFWVQNAAIHAQTEGYVDSLELAYDKAGTDSLRLEISFMLIDHFKNRDVKATIPYIDLADSLAQKLDLPSKIGRVKMFRGEALFNEAKYADAIKVYQEGLEVFRQANHQKGIADVYTGLSLVYLYTGQPDSVMIFASKALTKFELLKDTVGQMSALMKMGQVQHQMDNMNKAYEYFEKTAELGKLVNHTFYATNGIHAQGIVLNDLGSKSRAQGDSIKGTAQIKEAIEKFKLAESGFRKLNINQYIAAAIGNQGMAYKALRNWKASLQKYRESELLEKEFASPNQMSITSGAIGECLFHLGQYKEGLKRMEENLPYYRESNSLHRLKPLYSRLSQAYQHLNQFEKALLYKQEELDALDLLQDQQQDAIVQEMELKYESDKKENEISFLSSQNELTALKLNTARNRNWAFGLGLLIFGLLSLFLYSLYKRIAKQKAIIQIANEDKDTLLREIHHRVKNNLQVISSLLALQSKYIQDDNAIDALKQGQDRVQSMALIHQDLYQTDNLKGVNTQDYFIQLVDNLFDSYNISEDEIFLKMDVDPLMLDVDTMIPLGLVMNELVSNSLKHAFVKKQGGNIHVSLKEKDSILLFEVKDNGSGIGSLDEIEGKSFGYELIKAFAQKLKADITIQHEQGFGMQLKITNYKLAA